jgi:hypothetical protein
MQAAHKSYGRAQFEILLTIRVWSVTVKVLFHMLLHYGIP